MRGLTRWCAPTATVDTILGFLPFKDVVAFGCASTACRASSLRPVLWHSLYVRDFSPWRSHRAKPEVPLPRPSSVVCTIDHRVPRPPPAYPYLFEQHRRLSGHLRLYDASALKVARAWYWKAQKSIRIAAAVRDIRREQDQLVLRALPRWVGCTLPCLRIHGFRSLTLANAGVHNAE